MELGLVLTFVSRVRALAALDRALGSCDDACASGQVPAVRVACVLCHVGLAGNTTCRGILWLLDVLHNAMG